MHNVRVEFARVWRVVEVFLANFLLLAGPLREQTIRLWTGGLLQNFPLMVLSPFLVSPDLILVNGVDFPAILDTCKRLLHRQLLERRLLTALINLAFFCGLRPWEKSGTDVGLAEVYLPMDQGLLILGAFALVISVPSRFVRFQNVVLIPECARLNEHLIVIELQIKLVLLHGSFVLLAILDNHLAVVATDLLLVFGAKYPLKAVRVQVDNSADLVPDFEDFVRQVSQLQVHRIVHSLGANLPRFVGNGTHNFVYHQGCAALLLRLDRDGFGLLKSVTDDLLDTFMLEAEI